MHSVIYIDIVFLANLIMDYILLRITGLFILREGNRKRCLVAALAGSIVSCGLIGISEKINVPFGILIHGISSIFMVRISFGIRKGSVVFKTVIALYLLAFLTGGFWEALRLEESLTIKIFFITAGITYLGMNVVSGIWDYIQIRRKNVYPVTLFYDGVGYAEYGFYDTGNLLADEVNGKPVSVINGEIAEKILTERVTEKLKHLKDHPEEIKNIALFELNPHFIGYKTVGGSGIFPAITLDKIYIYTHKEQIEIEKPIFAVVFDSSIWESEHNILLNSRLL